MTIRYGCHGSTWDLDYDRESDRLDHILDVIADAGFAGLDAQISLLGKYKSSPESLALALNERGLRLAALTLPFSWQDSQESPEESELADSYINFLSHFPGAVMNVAPRTGPDRNHLAERQQQIIRCANAVGARARDKGVICSFHPSSPPTSYFRTADDYEILFTSLDSKNIGWTPDAGHIFFGGMNVYETVKKYASFIRHFHIKDARKGPEWCTMGTGDISFPELIDFLQQINYTGWIMVEEETEQSSADPDNAVRNISNYVNTFLK